MPITLITGTPGAGKTLNAVAMIVAELAKEHPRPIYTHGVNGFSDPRVLDLPDPLRWAECPDGSLIVIDEAHKVFPAGERGPPIPPVAALAEHRHRGFDFVLITQAPTLLCARVRKWVGEHRHLNRAWGAQMARVTTWSECVTDVQGMSTRSRGVGSVFKYPKALYGRYQSATLHTVKRRLPWRLMLLPICLLVVAGVGWYYVSGEGFDDNVDAARATATSGADGGDAVAEAAPRGGRAPGRKADTLSEPQTTAEYIVSMVPRIEGMPWTAPVFDDRRAEAEPQLYCMATAPRCVCLTEQGTRHTIDDAVCRFIAENGVYNPFQRVREPPPAPPSSQNRDAKAAPEVVRSDRGRTSNGGASGIEAERLRFPPPQPSTFGG